MRPRIMTRVSEYISDRISDIRRILSIPYPYPVSETLSDTDIGYPIKLSEYLTSIRIYIRLLFEHFGRTDSQEISVPLSSLGTIPRQRWQLSRAQCIYSFIKKKLFASLLSYHIVGAHLIGKIYS